MNRTFLLVVSLIVSITAISVLFYIHNKNTFSVGGVKLTFPTSIKITQKKYIRDEWLPNGYCGDPGVNYDCKLLLINQKNDAAIASFAISSPLQFGFLSSDSQECFKFENGILNFKNASMEVIEYYYNLDQITYDPELINQGKNPYDCSKVETTISNFHHLEGCNRNFCIWAYKDFNTTELNRIASEIIVK